MTCRICGAELPDGAMFCGECGSSTSATLESRRRVDPRGGDTTVVVPMPVRHTGIISIPVGGLEQIGPESEEARPTRFELGFSTGEVRIVFGTGLIGRRPWPQPGERFEHLVQIADRTLSVSKTHLEFGTHDGVLWVADRFSANGTVVRRPDDGALRCEPGRRYLVPRGSRVEIAEQFFLVG